MKKGKLIRSFLIMATMCLLAFVASCTDTGSSSLEPIEKDVTKISISNESIELEKLETAFLTATVENDEMATVNWTSTNEAVASVVDGKVEAISAGAAVIIASYEDTEARCLIKVNDNGLIPGIITNVGLGDALYLCNGDEFTLDYQITYNNKEITGAQVSFIMPENNFVEIVGNVIKAKEEGTTSITINAEWKGVSFNTAINVFVVENAYASLSNEASFLLYNDTRGGSVVASMFPTFIAEDKELTSEEFEIIDWNYDNEIISIDEEKLEVKGLAKGKTEIRATFQAKETGLTVEAVLPVSVELYDEDKTKEITIDTLYLNRDLYYVDIFDVFADKTGDDLLGLSVRERKDVTSGVIHNIPIENGTIRLNNIAELGLEGERKWQIQCAKFSYIVCVPLVDVDPTAYIVGKYNCLDWEYSMEIAYEKNDAVVLFKDTKNGNVVDSGYCTTTAWKNNDYKAGKIEMNMEGKVISSHPIKCYYLYSSGCWQMNLALNNSDSYSKELFSENIVAPFETMAGEYSNRNNWHIKYILKADGTCEMKGIDGFNFSSLGQYQLIPNTATSGKIVMTYETAFNNGQSVFEGNYSCSMGCANFDVTVQQMATPEKNFTKDNGSNVYQEYAGYYSSKYQDGWGIVFRFLADGTCIFDYHNWTGCASLGTYVIKDGNLYITMVSDYGGLKNYEGTYEMREDGYRYMIFTIDHAGPMKLREYRQQ